IEDLLCRSCATKRTDHIVVLTLRSRYHTMHDIERVLKIDCKDGAAAGVELYAVLECREKPRHRYFNGVFACKKIRNGERAALIRERHALGHDGIGSRNDDQR